MAERSIFARGGNGMTTGGLDGYLGPEAQDFSNLPEHLEPENKADQTPDVDCSGPTRDEPVCQIAKAEAERKAQSLKAGHH
jgi:hypothetical protein